MRTLFYLSSSYFAQSRLCFASPWCNYVQQFGICTSAAPELGRLRSPDTSLNPGYIGSRSSFDDPTLLSPCGKEHHIARHLASLPHPDDEAGVCLPQTQANPSSREHRVAVCAVCASVFYIQFSTPCLKGFNS
ncbi:hypothetical protein EDB85DRAFT_1948176 [Lactarius pseudohatsudake]|nr:hypothetical protein EDB85DRAFT_1948176 [Lactarius pseudohatsudake]